MSTDTEVRIRGLRALVETLGPVDAERFITLILREPFDYTQWQRHLWAEKGVDELSQAAMAMRSASPNTYEAPGCQGTKISSERFLAFFPPVGCQHGWPSAAGSDVMSQAGAPMGLHQTLLEVLSPFA